MIARLLYILALSVFLLTANAPSFPAQAGGAPDKADWPFQLRFMTGPPGGNWFSLGSSLSDIWSKEVLPTHSTSGGGVSNILYTNSGRGDLGFSVASFLSAALRGEEEFAGSLVENAVIMANLYAQVTYFLVGHDFAAQNNIKTVGDMLKQDGVRFGTLKPGTASEFTVKALFSKGYAITLEDLKRSKNWTVEYASYEGGADLLADGRIDCFVFSVGGSASIVKNIESKVDIALLAVEDAALEAVSAAYGTTSYTIVPGTYASVTTPLKTLGDYTCIVVRKDLPKSLVFELNKALWANKQSLAETVVDMQELAPPIALPQGIPCHPGSIEFWNSLK